MDIHELQAENARLQAALAETQRHLAATQIAFQATIDATPGVVYVRDPAGVFQRVNRAHAQLLGLPMDQVLGQRDADLFPPEIVAGFRENDQQAIAAGDAIEREETAVIAGETRLFRSIKRPIIDAEGTLHGTVGISMDITTEHERGRLLQAFLDHSPMVMYVKDLQGRYVLVNRQLEKVVAQEGADILGKTDAYLFPPDVVAGIQAHDTHVMTQDQVMEVDDVVQHGEARHIYQNIKFPLHDAQGRVYAMGAFALDVTEQRQFQAELEQRVAERTAELDQSKQDVLRELSTPLIPITDDVVIMPLIGTIDAARAQMVLETLLEGVAEHQAALVIVDITGVSTVDTLVAQALVQAAQAVRLLGAQVMLTGIHPAIAQTLVQLGIDLNGIETQGTLQAGVATALRRAMLAPQ